MACSLQVTFERGDRIYRGGDLVKGRVLIRADEELRHDSIKLSSFWRTHGRGNSHDGDRVEILLDTEGRLEAGAQATYPFEFRAPCWPLTYRGHFINLDHYVQVDVAVPWARDPSQAEDYVVLPGERPAEITGARGSMVSFQELPKPRSPVLRYVGCAFILFFLFLFWWFWLLLIGGIAVFGVITWVIGRIVAFRLGSVDVSIPHVIVCPGETLPVSLSFTPRSSFDINSITVRIAGIETVRLTCGTSTTTYTHTIHEETRIIRPAGRLVAHAPIQDTCLLQIPELGAWSVDKDDNKVTWKLEMRVDIPRYPDWTHEADIQLLPPQFLDDPTVPMIEHLEGRAVSSGVGGAPSTHPMGLEPAAAVPEVVEVPDGSHAVVAAAPPAPRVVEAPASADAPVAGDAADGLLELIREIEGSRATSSALARIIAAAGGRRFRVTVSVRQVTVTYGYLGTDERLRSGRTLVGKLEGTDREVKVLAFEARAPAVERPGAGALWQATVTAGGYDTLYDRVELHQVED